MLHISFSEIFVYFLRRNSSMVLVTLNKSWIFLLNLFLLISDVYFTVVTPIKEKHVYVTILGIMCWSCWVESIKANKADTDKLDLSTDKTEAT